MRICCLFLFAGILLIRPVFAQSVSIGLRGGWGQACHQRYFDRDYDRSFPLKPVAAAVLGANITVDLDAHLALEVGLQYEGKGNIRYAVKNQYHYVSLPVAIKWSPLQQQRISPYLRGGGYYAHLLYHQQTYINDGPILEIYLPEYQTPRRADFGAVAAIGADWQLSSHLQLNADLSATRGLRGLYPNNPLGLQLTYQFYNIGWHLATGLRYTL